MPVRAAIVDRITVTGLEDAEAYATPELRAGEMVACQIVFRADVASGVPEQIVRIASDPILRKFVAAHELWHCFQFEHGDFGRGEWLDEGQASWVASVIASDPSPAAGWWDTWLGTPHASLWQRSYDALGLYAAAEAAGHEPFPVLLRMYDLRNQDAVSALFGGEAYEEAMRLVAKTLVRAPAYGPEWEASGRGITATRATMTLQAELLAVVRDARVGAFGSLPTELQIGEPREQEVLRIVVNEGAAVRAVEFADGVSFDLAGGQELRFCLPRGVCTCEDGSPPGGQELPPLPASRGADRGEPGRRRDRVHGGVRRARGAV